MATGKHAISICQRCGFQYPYKKVRREMGTRLLVCPECNDGKYNRVTNPLNEVDLPSYEDQGLWDPSPARVEPVLTSASTIDFDIYP